MIFRQVIQEDLGCASYFVGDSDAGRVAVIDPQFDIDPYLELSELFGAQITDIFETHTHADHISGRGRLVEATGATIHINGEAGVDYPHEPLAGGDEVRIGEVVVRALHVPGHRPEHTAFALIDSARGPEPWALVSGDSLLVGDVARPDLAIGGEEGARILHRSISTLLEDLPAEAELWPGHVGGSTCGSAGIDMKTSSTLGYERAHNAVLGLDENAFAESLNSGLGERPANYEGIVEINSGPLWTDALEVPAVDPAGAGELIRGGAIPVDVRPLPDFDRAHIPGAVCIPVGRPGFATALARALGDVEVLIAGADEEQARRAARYTESVGLSRPVGVLAGGMAAWEGAGLATEAMETIDATGLGTADGIQVVDVRDAETFGKGSLPGAVSAMHTDLGRLPDGVDPGKPVAVVCATGKRAGIGASLLRRAGAERVLHVTGGGIVEALAARAGSVDDSVKVG